MMPYTEFLKMKYSSNNIMYVSILRLLVGWFVGWLVGWLVADVVVLRMFADLRPFGKSRSFGTNCE
jgi:hypothetical protein